MDRFGSNVSSHEDQPPRYNAVARDGTNIYWPDKFTIPTHKLPENVRLGFESNKPLTGITQKIILNVIYDKIIKYT